MAGQCQKKDWEALFYKEITSIDNGGRYKIITAKKYSEILAELSAALQTVGKKTQSQYRILKRFQILDVGGVKKLIAPCAGDNFKYYVTAEELFGVIKTAHNACGHGGRDRIEKETGLKYANVTRESICLFLSMCDVCQQKKKKIKRGLVSKPIIHKQFNSRCQVDLIDLQTQADGEFKYIMVYQDHLTKFVILRALKTKTAAEVAANLKEVFSIFGAPSIFHTDNGREFKNQLVRELTQLWPEVKIVHGKPRHSQTQGSVERCNQDVENMLAAYLKDHKDKTWTQCLSDVQIMKNRAYHSGIRQSPYKAMFGIEFRVGLSSTNLPDEVLSKIGVDVFDEDELEDFLNVEGVDDSTIFNHKVSFLFLLLFFSILFKFFNL